jgi:AAA family ATP:ADP antiporter
MYQELLQLVGDTYPDLESRSQFFARLDTAVNVLAWVFQGFVVAWLIRAIGLSGALITTPVVAFVSFAALAFAFAAAMPILAVLGAGQVIRRAGEFGIAKPSRDVLYTIVDAETKYKAKNFIDTVMQRGSDLAGVWLHVGLQSLGVGLFGFSMLCGAGMVAATAISWGLGRSFERRRTGTS